MTDTVPFARRIVLKYIKFAPFLTLLCIVVGCSWLFVLPLDDFSRKAYISENALLPGQVEAYFGGSEMNIIRAYRAEVDTWIDADNPNLYAENFEKILKSFHLKTGYQTYDLSEERFGIGVNGTNVYGILRAPRGDATEAIVLSTSWKTVEGEIDIGGVSLLLALAGYFRRWSLWSKDIIFLLVAEPLAGTSLWLEAYHSNLPRFTSSLPLKSGEIQAAIQISHPEGTHFDKISIGYEGINGQLANLDLINSAIHIAGAQLRIPTLIQGIQNPEGTYKGRLETLFKGMVQQGLGLSSGSGIFGKYKIDAITLKAVGGHGDHDDIAFGRVVESLCRSLNNLLEHLHQSFFFYFVLSPNGNSLVEPGRFVSIGTYLPAAMILAASFTITAISLWIRYSSTPDSSVDVVEKTPPVLQPQNSSKPISFPLGVVVILHGIGVIVFTCFGSVQKLRLPGLSGVSLFCSGLRLLEGVIPLVFRRIQLSRWTQSPETTSTDSHLIKTFSLLVLGMWLSTLSTLNFSLGFFIGVLCAPLAFIQPLWNNDAKGTGLTILQLLVLQLVSPLNWFYLVSTLEFGRNVSELAKLYLFAWKVWGAWTSLVWWCIWWPAWMTGMVVLAFPK